MLWALLLAAAPQTGQRCIETGAILSRRAEDGSTILFEMLDGSRYRNHLPGRCPGLAGSANGRALAFEQQGGHLCQGDSIRVVGTSAAGVPCPLGRFELDPDHSGSSSPSASTRAKSPATRRPPMSRR